MLDAPCRAGLDEVNRDGTKGTLVAFADMSNDATRPVPSTRASAAEDTVWLVTNPASGSNDDSAVDALVAQFVAVGKTVAHIVRFPDEPLPTPTALTKARVATLAIFAGDGTVGAAIAALEAGGWDGAVLVLPGGTKNLLAHRHHGEAEPADIVAAWASGGAHCDTTVRVDSAHGVALGEAMAGPGTAWGEVREAMRDGGIAALASGAATAISETASAPRIRLAQPDVGRDEGYMMITLTPTVGGIEVRGYFAETALDLLRGAGAVARMNFRDGPHEVIGTFADVTLANIEADTPVGVMLDGEATYSAPTERFTLGRSTVRFWMTAEGSA